MNLQTINESLSADDTPKDIMARLRLLTGIRTNTELGNLLSPILGVKRTTITRWINGDRCSLRNTKQHIRCLQLIELLLKSYQSNIDVAPIGSKVSLKNLV